MNSRPYRDASRRSVRTSRIGADCAASFSKIIRYRVTHSTLSLAPKTMQIVARSEGPTRSHPSRDFSFHISVRYAARPSSLSPVLAFVTRLELLCPSRSDRASSDVGSTILCPKTLYRPREWFHRPGAGSRAILAQDFPHRVSTLPYLLQRCSLCGDRSAQARRVLRGQWWSTLIVSEVLESPCSYCLNCSGVI